MPRANLRPGRQAQEIGAMIVDSWFKRLPIPATISDPKRGPPFTLTIDRPFFQVNDNITIRKANDTYTGLVVTDVQNYINLTIKRADGNDFDPGVDLTNGHAIHDAKPVEDVKDELEFFLQQIVDVRVEAVFDEKHLIHVAVPRIPDSVLTRGDLIDYLHNYHDYGQGRHYHDELGVAVLFGCR
jgi:hypothetical protein